MPLIKAFNRCLQYLPARSSAYANIYRWCSTPSPSRTSEQPQQAQTQPSPITSSGSGAPHTPASLDLGLNFATMDFEAVVRATHAAMARERGAGHLSQQREQELEKQAGTSAAPQQSARASGPAPTLASERFCHARAPASHSAPSSQRSCVDASPAPHPQMQQQAQLPPRSFRRNGTAARYSLQDMLKDCVADGQWARALHLFTSAVDQACRQVLVPFGTAPGVVAASGAPAAAIASDPRRVAVNSTAESECFVAIRKMLAALPPRQPRDRATHFSRAASVTNMRGIMRWTGQHYYLLWKCLLETGHVEELERVWSVMQHTGFVEYQMEERTVNAMMALLRRTSRSTERVIATVVPPGRPLSETTSHQKGILRELMKGLEQAAAARKFRLAAVNRRTAEGIRIAEALKHADQGYDGRDTSADAGTTPDNGAGAAFVTRLEEEAVVVGDFNGLLRRARSSEATERILRMMEQLNIEKEAVTYASIIAALHSPHYVLPGHTAEELTAHLPGGANLQQHANVEEGGSTLKDGQASGPTSTSVDLSGTKTSYEAYRAERIEAGMAWFAACPAAHRTADVFNELLYLLRAKSHWCQFDTVLVQLRGNAVVTETEWPERLSEAADGVPPSVSAAGGASRGSATILAPRWSTWPNGKTYELLIQRARYVHQWEVMWALYEEMIGTGVRGTARVYEVLLLEARSHPPQAVLAAEHSSNADGSSSFLLRLYEELRRNGGDVHSFTGTLNVINAWTRARSRSNRWRS
ncbi:KPAF2 / kinetoplast polyadenylation/uridylation factor 2 [Leishmania donovani]|nr:KPAF2 / kinetoplast polyadenylation/uridylation factor 2 [Leishmania donovani]